MEPAEIAMIAAADQCRESVVEMVMMLERDAPDFLNGLILLSGAKLPAGTAGVTLDLQTFNAIRALAAIGLADVGETILSRKEGLRAEDAENAEENMR
jgi:hypothetical protein